ncbi:FUSC family protein [Mycolicibacterium frederiksbergense]|uniref:FUSC family protein n=1 Tax=Mycolicibacterium frederiksbergense TaxID=117567 RepID=UPI00265C1A9E|nr:FUSC family protein [Mycolicibacterium frederiksbergense]MDO0977990.1 FUSC family protein [Mycolicibacterium frederiksbergense]
MAALVRPVGRAQWAMAGCLALTLGAILALSAALGHAELGSAVGLGFVLTAVPSLPQGLRAGLGVIALRAVTVAVGVLVVVLTVEVPGVHAVAVVVAAVGGALVDKIGPTAGLVVVLAAIDIGPSEAAHGLPANVWPYAVGSLTVLVAWSAWWCAARARRPGEEPAASAPTVRPPGRRGHAARVAVAVSVAVLIAEALPDDLVGGQWLVTSVLLTIQPHRDQTRTRIVQRLGGNTVGALIAAALLGAQPPAPVVISAATVLFGLAMALRPVNYTWWAITGPPVLLIVSEYPELFPWYEGGVRLAMNLAGAAIVVLVVFGLPRLTPWANRASTKSDSVSKTTKRGLG